MRQSLLALVALLAACEAAVNPDKIKPSLPADASAFCTAARSSLVRRQVACLGAESRWVSAEPSLPNCSNWSKAAARGTVTFDPVAAFDCLTALDQASCDDLVRLATQDLPSSCQGALRGLRLTGQPCYDDVECGGGYCEADVARCPAACRGWVGTNADCSAAKCGPGLLCVDVGVAAVQLRCRPVVIAASGGACGLLAAGVTVCTHGTQCDATGRCSPQRTSGPCAADDQCAAGYRCAGSTITNRSCQPAVPLGGVCTVGSGACILGTSCANGLCTLYPGVGGTCGGGADTVGCTGSTCVVPAGTTAGTCVAPFACLIP